ncbi:MAG: Lrp/AsnC family transcriptional regulator [Betaproteobacteria bacterium]|nr:Lrp/AsnC family transcriptional regulator [Betaproteobacteria bacterium]MDH4326409.1 Lrp/AsnC family transcriptional regulator [Betaproteobacteria bacterium]MDH5577812.1 Lrp/AsnC family transcriptional regulator [Betaproteobacteria bacterium]
MDEIERAIVNRLQGGFPLAAHPFAAAAAALGTSEARLIETLQRMLEAGTLTRFGPLYDAERLGGAFTLCAMCVPKADFERIADLVNAHPEVAHNYERAHRFNMWFVLATASRAQIPAVIAAIEAETGCAVLDLPREREYFIDLRLPA